MDEFTRKFNAAEDKEQQVHYILTSVYESLKEKGYDPINQIVGYILSEDPTYITNHNSARSLICKIDRDELLHVLAKSYLELYNIRSTQKRTPLRASFFCVRDGGAMWHLPLRIHPPVMRCRGRRPRRPASAKRRHSEPVTVSLAWESVPLVPYLLTTSRPSDQTETMLCRCVM